MGSYLRKPVTDKESEDAENEKMACGASSMQGWREFQEVRTHARYALPVGDVTPAVAGFPSIETRPVVLPGKTVTERRYR